MQGTELANIPDVVRNMLLEPRYAVVATINPDGSPQQTVVWYELRDDIILMNTRVGRLKEKNLQRDPRISFCIEDGERYLTIKGHVELDYDRDRSQADMKALAIRYDGKEQGERQAAELYSKQERVNIHMTIDAFNAYNL